MSKERKSIRFDYSGEVVGKSSIRTSNGRAYYPEKTRKTMDAIRYITFIEMKKINMQKFNGPLGIDLTIYIGIPKSWTKKKTKLALTGELKPTVKPDCSNVLKLVEDSMQGILFVDDNAFIECHEKKVYSVKEHLSIHVYEIDGIPAYNY